MLFREQSAFLKLTALRSWLLNDPWVTSLEENPQAIHFLMVDDDPG